MPKPPATSRTKPAALQRRLILEAAIACFDEKGPEGTVLADVAGKAGMARRTLYRFFATKTELLEAVAVNRLDELVARVKRRIDRCTTLREALVTGSVEIVRAARADRIFMSVMAAAVKGDLMLYFVAPETPIAGHSHLLWNDFFIRARARGELDAAIPDEALHNWLRSVHLMLFMRIDLDRRGQVELLERFVLPGLIAR